jgi:TolB-like protein/thioredoxin-like negative regulator of GroEL
LDPVPLQPDDPLERAPRLRLDSWKEIAAYLKRDIRTVQLWEKKEGLPIHRHTHASRASVYAFPAEIDAWQQNRKPAAVIEAETPLESVTSPEPTVVPASPQSKEEKATAPERRRRISTYVLLGALAGMLLGAAGFAIFRVLRRARMRGGAPAVLAVLPFEDLSPGRVEDYLADGLTDDLITDLGRSERLQVISRTSVRRFKDRHEPLRQIADTLHANILLEGTVSYSAGRARITAQLIDAATDRHIWANSYERPFDNVISMQDEVASQIAMAVAEKLTGDLVSPGVTGPAVDPDVRIAYMRGRFFWNKRDEAGLKQAIVYFNQAITKDANFAPAYSGLADCYNLLSVWGSLSPRDAFPKARSAALRALQLDPDSAEAYTSLAFETYRYEWDFTTAENDFRKAILLNPNYATAHQWYGEFLGDLRRFGPSVAESQKAEQLDPLSTIVGSDLADSYMHAGHYPEAVAELQKILAMDPGFVPAHLYLSEVYGLAGQPAKALEEKQKYIDLSGDRRAREVLEITQEWAAGNQSDAHRRMESLIQDPGEGRFDYFHAAQMYVSVGDSDKAFDCLEKAYQEHSWWLVTVLVDPGLMPLRQDPRLRNLAQRVGLPLE